MSSRALPARQLGWSPARWIRRLFGLVPWRAGLPARSLWTALLSVALLTSILPPLVEAQPIPGPQDFSMRLLRGWTVIPNPPPQTEREFVVVGVAQAPPVLVGGSPVVPAQLQILVSPAGASEFEPTQLTLPPPLKVFEAGLGCTFDEVSGNACVHIIAGSENPSVRADVFSIIKNGYVWTIMVVGLTPYFDANRPALETMLFTFHTDFGAPTPVATCAFKLGFKMLHDLIPDVIGDCAENERVDTSNGDVVQRTTRGTLFYRPSSNLTWFTDGHRTWLWGPCGLQDRLNIELFPWERGEPLCGTVSPPPSAGIPEVVPAELHAAWRAMAGTVLRLEGRGDVRLADIVAEWLAESQATVSVGDLNGAFGLYQGQVNQVTIDTDALSAPPEAQAAVLVHEIRHAFQQKIGLTGCVDREVDSLRVEVIAWGLMRSGKTFPPHPLVNQLDAEYTVFRQRGDPGLYGLVVNTGSYQEQCRIWTPS